MSYRVFAIRSRPQDFSSVIGQAPVVSALSNALDKNKMHHAYLFTGTRGVGKTTIARILAKCLSCERGVVSVPCHECNNCQAVARGKFLDLIEIDAASRTKVEDTRALLDTVIYAPTQGRYKIYLIDEVHMLSTHSFNALLKTLEEPPSHVKFILATTDPQKIPATILSRCLQFTLKLVPSDVIANHLAGVLQKDNIEYEEMALRLIAESAQGSVRDALSLLEQAVAVGGGNVSGHDVRVMLGRIPGMAIIELLNHILVKDKIAVFKQINDCAMAGVDFGQLLMQLVCLLHQVALFQQAPDVAFEIEAELKADIANLARLIKSEDLQIYYQIALLAKRDLPYSPQPKMAVEMALIRMLSFVPIKSVSPSTSSDQSSPKKIAETAEVAGVSEKAEQNSVEINHDNWVDFVNTLELKAVALQLIRNCEFVSLSHDQLVINLDIRFNSLLNQQRHEELANKIQAKLNRKIKLIINKTAISQEAAVTPAAVLQEELKRKQDDLLENMQNNPNINKIVSVFDGELKLDSIEILKQ